jgi:hypothetical protein
MNLADGTTQPDDPTLQFTRDPVGCLLALSCGIRGPYPAYRPQPVGHSS